MNKSTISVIIPTYNGASHIEYAIKSVIDQPYKNIEVIVVNDGSNDDTSIICKKYIGRIKYFETANLGAGHARNFACYQSTGTWIMFLDNDDLLLDSCITDNFVRELESCESNGVDVIYTPYIHSDYLIKQTISIYQSENWSDIKFIPKHEFWTCIYRKDFLLRKNIKFYEYREQDIATAFRYLVKFNNPIAITRNDLPFYLHRNNPQSNTNTWNIQTLHSIKATVYYDLYINYRTESTESWLFENVVEQLHSYYWSTIRAKIFDESERKMANEVLHKLPKSFCENKLTKRHYYTNYILKIISLILAKKHTSSKKTHSEDKRLIEFDSSIMKRLAYVSALFLN